MSSAIGRDLKARNGNFNFDVQVWVKFFSSLLDVAGVVRGVGLGRGDGTLDLADE